MGSPAWGSDPRFATKADRVKNWDALHALMSQWSRQHDKQWIADTAQRAHVPSFPLREVAEHLDTPQMRHRRYYRSRDLAGKPIQVPGPPFGLTFAASQPEASRAARSAAAVGRARARFQLGDRRPDDDALSRRDGRRGHQGRSARQGRPGARSELHTVLGQAKKGIVLDLKKPEAVEIARALAAKSDILIENFATGVMDRLGLGAEALKALNPNLIYISASGMGRTGPECARGRLWNAAAVLCRVRRLESPSRCPAAHRLGVARSRCAG